MRQAIKILMALLVIQFICSSAVFASKQEKIKILKDIQNLCGKLDHLIDTAEPKLSKFRSSVEGIEDKAAKLRRVRKSKNMDDKNIQDKIDSHVKELNNALKESWKQKPKGKLKERIKKALVKVHKYGTVKWN